MTNPYLQYLYENSQLNDDRWAFYVDTIRKKKSPIPHPSTSESVPSVEVLWSGLKQHLEVLARVAKEKNVTELIDLYYQKYIAHLLKPSWLDVTHCREMWLQTMDRAPELKQQWMNAPYQLLSSPNVNLHLWADISREELAPEPNWQALYSEQYHSGELCHQWKPRPEYENHWVSVLNPKEDTPLLRAYLRFQLHPIQFKHQAPEFKWEHLEEFYRQYSKEAVHDALQGNDHSDMRKQLCDYIQQSKGLAALASYDWLLNPERVMTFKEEDWAAVWLTRLKSTDLAQFDARLDTLVKRYADHKAQLTYAALMLTQRGPRSVENGLEMDFMQSPQSYWPERNNATAAHITSLRKQASGNEFARSLIQRMNQLHEPSAKLLAHDLNYLCMQVIKTDACGEQRSELVRSNAPLLLALSTIDATIRHESLVTSTVKMQWMRQFNQQQMVSLNNPMIELLEKYYPTHEKELTSLRFKFIDWYSSVPNHSPETLEHQNKTLTRLWDALATLFNVPYLNYEELKATASLMNASHYQLLHSTLLPGMEMPTDTKELWSDLAATPNSML